MRRALATAVQTFALGGIVALVAVVGQIPDESTAVPMEPPALIAAPVVATGGASADTNTPTEREIARLCRGWRESMFRSEGESPAVWQRSWQSGWRGPLGKIAVDAHLTFDWRCRVDAFSAAEGFLCRPREGSPVAFYLHPLPWTTRQVRGEDPVQVGDVLQLRGLRRALSEDDGVVFSIGEDCTIGLILDDTALIQRAPSTPPPPGATAGI